MPRLYLPPGVAAHHVATLAQVEVALAITLHLRVARVAVATVHLDDHALVSPKRIDRVHADSHIHLREGEAMTAAEVEEKVLEVAAGAGVLEAVQSEGSVEPCGAGSADAGHRIDRAQVEELEEVGLGDGLPHTRERATEAKSRRVRGTGVTGN